MADGRENQSANVVALMGSASELGRNLLVRLAQNPRWKKIICFDLPAPLVRPANCVFYKVDFSEPTINLTLLHAFEKEGVDTVVHTAFFSNPEPDPAYMHDYECIGTLQILAACAQARIRKIVAQSTTAVYGARTRSPLYHSEQQPLRADLSYDYLREKIDVENQVVDFRSNHPDTVVTTLRLATLVGPGSGNFVGRYLHGALVPTVLGYDPLWQLLHIEDALDAFERTLEADILGVFNYAAPGVLPLSSIVSKMGGKKVPMPELLLRTQAAAWRFVQPASFPKEQVDYLKHSCLADCTRAFKVLGMRPKRNIQQTIASVARGQSPQSDISA